MNIINIKNKEDLITLDLRLKQLRYLVDIKNRGFIHFIDLSIDDIIGYNYLFREEKNVFLKCIKEDIESYTDIKININNLEIIENLMPVK